MSLAGAIRRREPFLAVNVGDGGAVAIARAAAAGADCAFIDAELAPIAPERLAALAAAARAAGVASVVRCEGRASPSIEAYVASGIDGLVVPDIEGAADCDAVAARIGGTLFVAQIESVAGHERLGEIARHPAVALVLIGPNDLARSMGHPGAPQHPDVVAAIDDIAERLAALGMPFGLPVTEASVAGWTARGAVMLYNHYHQLSALGADA